MRKFNEFTINPQNGDGMFLAWGDVHFGSPTCNIEKAMGYLNYALEKHIPIIGMGDYAEFATRSSIGAGVHEQTMTPQQQIDWLESAIKPLVREKLVIGLHRGNHEFRAMVSCGVDIVAMVCRILNVPYLGEACYHLFRVGKQTYKVYSCHGRSGARLPQTKILACIRLSQIATADLYLHAHLHELTSMACVYFDYDSRTKMKVKKVRHFVLTGHFLEYEGSYAEAATMIPSRTGCPKILLEAEKKDIHISF